MTRFRLTRCTVAVLTGLITVSACGGSSKQAAPNGGTAQTTAPTAAPTAAESNPSGDIPDNQAFVAFADPGGRFTVTVPEGWARSSTGTATVFADKYNSVRVESRSVASAPTPDSARKGELAAIQSSSPGFVAGKISTVSRQAGSAVLITYQASSPPNPVTGKTVKAAIERYEFWRAGREVVLTVAAPVGSDNVDPWRNITDSFTWTR